MLWEYVGGSPSAFLDKTSGKTSNDHKQIAGNSCWACSGRHISNFFAGLSIYDSDTDFLEGYNEATGQELNLNVMSSAADALAKLKIGNNTDDHRIPTLDEIADQIRQNRPLLANVAERKNPPKRPQPELNATGGHWLVITGVDPGAKQIAVFDPADGRIHQIDYNDTKCTLYSNSYWMNTSYLDPPSRKRARSTSDLDPPDAPPRKRARRS